MPLLRKGVLLPVEGADFSQPSTFINDRSGFPTNMMYYRNELRKRPGKTLYESAALLSQIMGLGMLELTSLKYLMRASKTTLQNYNTATSAWDTINATAFTGGDEDFFHFANVTESQFITFTNWVDKIRKWTGSGNNSSLGGNPPFAKFLTYVTPYLLLAYTNDGATIESWKVQWCDTGTPEVWTGGNSGSSLLSRDSSPIQNIMKLNEFAAVYKKESLWLGRTVDTSDIFIFDCIKTGVGLSASRSLVDVEGYHYFQGYNDFYRWNGLREEPIGGPVRDYVFSRLDRNKIQRCHAIHVKDLWEVWFFIVVSGQAWPTEVWKYNYRTGFWYFDTCNNVTCAAPWNKVSTQSWDDDTPGSWDGALDTWDAADTTQNWEDTVFGDSSGHTSLLDRNTTNDLGVAVSSFFESKDFTADSMEFYKRWLQLDVWARGSVGAKLYVDYSTDFGSVWTNIPCSSSAAYITLTETTQLFRVYFDVIAEHIRFRFRNAESGEMFYLQSFYPYYLGHAEARA